MINVDLYESYADLNRELDDWAWIFSEKPEPFTADNCIEHHDLLIVGVRKWTDSGLSEKGPDFSWLGYEFGMHLSIVDKYDVFIYTRG